MSAYSKTLSAAGPDHLAGSLAKVEKALEDLRYGQIVLTVHDGKVRQLDITEKLRFAGS